ncbi:hypothetical protein BU16DRAFT_557716 [Lophium mytilinum]|uniref:Uncharacterized protein n=1 Tax=Lophium mytilinum TaxID=390894 RepID=A0A6A6R7C1_9PEZI|nr:hypothetical protein BU16DRAFT_557716 [Lophium mytilinum]
MRISNNKTGKVNRFGNKGFKTCNSPLAGTLTYFVVIHLLYQSFDGEISVLIDLREIFRFRKYTKEGRKFGTY